MKRSPLVALPRASWKLLLIYDEAVLVRVRSWEWPWATLLMRSITQTGDPSGWIALGGALLASGGDGHDPDQEALAHADLLHDLRQLRPDRRQIRVGSCLRGQPLAYLSPGRKVRAAP